VALNTPALPAVLAGHAVPAGHLALGGGGLGRFLVHLFIWRMIWRLGMLIWRIPTIGPGVLLLIVLAIAALIIFRARRGAGWPGRRPTGFHRDRGAPGPGPRAW
jgi:hypothetical protein